MLYDLALRTYLHLCLLFRSKKLSANTNLSFYKALSLPIITYACPVCLEEALSNITQQELHEQREKRRCNLN
jgi:hypothetical protein